MDSEKKIIGYDIDGADTVTAKLRALVNSFPGRGEGESILFAELAEKGGNNRVVIGDGQAHRMDSNTITASEYAIPVYIIGIKI